MGGAMPAGRRRALRPPTRAPLLLSLALAILSADMISLGMLDEGGAPAERRFRWHLDTDLSQEERENWGGKNCPRLSQSPKDRIVLMECSNSTEDASETSGSFAIDPGCYHFGTCLAHECESRTQQFPLVLQCGLVRRSLPLPIEPGWIFLDRCAAPHLFIRSNAWCQNESCSDHIGAVRFTYAGRYCFSFETANRTPTTERHSLVMLLYIVMSVVLGWIGVALCQKVRMLRGVHRAPAQLGAAQIAVVPQQQQHRVVKESGPLPILVEDPEGHVQFGLQCGAPGGDGNRSRDIEMQLLPLTTGPDSSLGSPTLADHTPGASTSQGES